jgi:hypothetical protein
MPSRSNAPSANSQVNTYRPTKDWHTVLYRCPTSGNFLAEGGNSLFPSKFEASKYAKAATKVDGKRRLVARVVRRYVRKPASMVRDDYAS